MKDDNKVFKALADPTRRLILDALSERKEQTFYELQVRLIMRHQVNMTRQGISKHLRILEKAGLVQTHRKGRFKVLSFLERPIKDISDRWINRLIERKQSED